VIAVHRLRWQMELAFKRLKIDFGLHRLARNAVSCDIYVILPGTESLRLLPHGHHRWDLGHDRIAAVGGLRTFAHTSSARYLRKSTRIGMRYAFAPAALTKSIARRAKAVFQASVGANSRGNTTLFVTSQ
jgi:hypothetical protein